MTVAEPKEAPEPVEPGSLASSALDKLLVEWRASSTIGLETHAANAAAYVIDEGRFDGYDVREWITALGKRLTEAAGALGSAPFGDAKIAAFTASLGPDAEEPTRSV